MHGDTCWLAHIERVFNSQSSGLFVDLFIMFVFLRMHWPMCGGQRLVAEVCFLPPSYGSWGLNLCCKSWWHLTGLGFECWYDIQVLCLCVLCLSVCLLCFKLILPFPFKTYQILKIVNPFHLTSTEQAELVHLRSQKTSPCFPAVLGADKPAVNYMLQAGFSPLS